MTEKLLQFIWQFQYFNQHELTTREGEPVMVLFPGLINHNQGPDFLNAKIRKGNTTWAGTVELHVRASDWKKHHHEGDKNYHNVILHVVWLDDEEGSAAGPGEVSIPVLELQNRVSKLLLQRYGEWMKAISFIPCNKSIQQVPALTWKSWKERLLPERLLRKAAAVEADFQLSNHHWEETFWWVLSRNFGLKVNAALFEAVAKSIPVTILAKHKRQLHQLESLLFGQAGLLTPDLKDDYPKLLQREYHFLRRKYQLKPVHLPVYFLRMRPGNFPTIRLAQLAALLNGPAHLFSKIKEASSLAEIKEWFSVTVNDYWHSHYKFDEAGTYKEKKMGPAMIDSLVINTVAPVLFAYGNYHQENLYKFRAVQWLQETKQEVNPVTNGFRKLGIGCRDAFDSQALLELKNEYCNQRKCLECAIGNSLLKQMNQAG